MPPELTSKQKALLTYLEREIQQHGKAPSLRQAAAEFNVSHAAIVQLIAALEEKGRLKRGGHYSRTLHLLNRAQETAGLQRWAEIPVVGRIAAGLPMYAQQEWEGSLVVDASLFRGPNLFALRVKGDSMIQAGIWDGDFVICEPRQFARNRDIVVALIRQEEATVKRFFLRHGRIELRPENDRHAPQVYGLDEVLIQGKVIGLQRLKVA